MHIPTENSRQANSFKARAGAFFAALQHSNDAHVAAHRTKYGFDFAAGRPLATSEKSPAQDAENTRPTSFAAQDVKPAATAKLSEDPEGHAMVIERRPAPLRLRGKTGKQVPGLRPLNMQSSANSINVLSL